MTDPTQQLLFLPPIPLATGGVVEDEESGELRPVTGVEVVVSTGNGEQTRIRLVQRHGAWWAP